MCVHLLLLGVELEALGQRARLRLVVLLPVAVNALSVRNVLVLGVSEQTAEKVQSANHTSSFKHLHQRELMEKRSSLTSLWSLCPTPPQS